MHIKSKFHFQNLLTSSKLTLQIVKVFTYDLIFSTLLNTILRWNRHQKFLWILPNFYDWPQLFFKGYSGYLSSIEQD